MSGHGHVIPNANGSKARCGGMALCSTCRAEAKAVAKQSRLGEKEFHFSIGDPRTGSYLGCIGRVWGIIPRGYCAEIDNAGTVYTAFGDTDANAVPAAIRGWIGLS